MLSWAKRCDSQLCVSKATVAYQLQYDTQVDCNPLVCFVSGTEGSDHFIHLHPAAIML